MLQIKALLCCARVQDEGTPKAGQASPASSGAAASPCGSWASCGHTGALLNQQHRKECTLPGAIQNHDSARASTEDALDASSVNQGVASGLPSQTATLQLTSSAQLISSVHGAATNVEMPLNRTAQWESKAEDVHLSSGSGNTLLSEHSCQDDPGDRSPRHSILNNGMDFAELMKQNKGYQSQVPSSAGHPPVTPGALYKLHPTVSTVGAAVLNPGLLNLPIGPTEVVDPYQCQHSLESSSCPAAAFSLAFGSCPGAGLVPFKFRGDSSKTDDVAACNERVGKPGSAEGDSAGSRRRDVPASMQKGTHLAGASHIARPAAIDQMSVSQMPPLSMMQLVLPGLQYAGACGTGAEAGTVGCHSPEHQWSISAGHSAPQHGGPSSTLHGTPMGDVCTGTRSPGLSRRGSVSNTDAGYNMFSVNHVFGSRRGSYSEASPLLTPRMSAALNSYAACGLDPLLSAQLCSIQSTPNEAVLGPILGKGSYGKVFQGTWRDQTVAIKVVDLEQLGNGNYASHNQQQATLQRIEEEAALGICLRHPNIAATLSAFTVEEEVAAPARSAGPGSITLVTPSRSTGGWPCVDSYQTAERSDQGGLLKHLASSSLTKPMNPGNTWKTYIIMEYCPAGSLRTALTRGKLAGPHGMPKLKEVLPLAWEAAAALHYLHHHNIIHGDLKADNVLLSILPPEDAAHCGRTLQAKVADFGQSTLMECSAPTDNTPSGASGMTAPLALATATHSAPEVLSGGPQSYESDVYALGVVLWELYTAGTPYKQYKRYLDLFLVKTSQPTQAILEFPDHCPQDYVQLCHDCWAEAAGRPTAAQAMARLEALASQLVPDVALQLPGRCYELEAPDDDEEDLDDYDDLDDYGDDLVVIEEEDGEAGSELLLGGGRQLPGSCQSAKEMPPGSGGDDSALPPLHNQQQAMAGASQSLAMDGRDSKPTRCVTFQLPKAGDCHPSAAPRAPDSAKAGTLVTYSGVNGNPCSPNLDHLANPDLSGSPDEGLMALTPLPPLPQDMMSNADMDGCNMFIAMCKEEQLPAEPSAPMHAAVEVSQAASTATEASTATPTAAGGSGSSPLQDPVSGSHPNSSSSPLDILNHRGTSYSNQLSGHDPKASPRGRRPSRLRSSSLATLGPEPLPYPPGGHSRPGSLSGAADGPQRPTAGVGSNHLSPPHHRRLSLYQRARSASGAALPRRGLLGTTPLQPSAGRTLGSNPALEHLQSRGRSHSTSGFACSEHPGCPRSRRGSSLGLPGSAYGRGLRHMSLGDQVKLVKSGCILRFTSRVQDEGSPRAQPDSGPLRTQGEYGLPNYQADEGPSKLHLSNGTPKACPDVVDEEEVDNQREQGLDREIFISKAQVDLNGGALLSDAQLYLDRL